MLANEANNIEMFWKLECIFHTVESAKPQAHSKTVLTENIHLLTEGKGALSPSIADNTENRFTKLNKNILNDKSHQIILQGKKIPSGNLKLLV